MSAPEKLYTEREMVEAKRETWISASQRMLICTPAAMAKLRRTAADLFPLPKVEKPRVVTIPSGREACGDIVIHLRVVDGRVEYCYAYKRAPEPPFLWSINDLFTGVKEGDVVTGDFENVVRALARENLIDKPTELVEDDSHV